MMTESDLPLLNICLEGKTPYITPKLPIKISISKNISPKPEHIEAVVQRCSVKKVFLEISQNSQENTCARVSFLIKLQTSGFLTYTVPLIA